MHHEVEVDIAEEPERVWAVLHDVAAWPSWTPTMDEVRLLDDGPFQVGSRALVSQPKLRPMVWTVTSSEPGREFSWRGGGPGFTLLAGHRVERHGDGSRVLLTVDLTGPLAPLLALLVGGRVREYVDQESRSLRERCEAPAG